MARTQVQHIPNSEFLKMRGVISILNTPDDAALTAMTRETLENNGMVDRSADRAEMASPLIPGAIRAGVQRDQVRGLHHQGEPHL